jgi:hypothetical protein
VTSLALLAVLLAAGWYFYRQWHYTRFEALRHPGHPQYFGAALCSAYLFGLSVGVHALAMKVPAYTLHLNALQAMLPLQVSNTQTADELKLHLALTLWCLFFAGLLPLLFNDPLTRAPSLALVIASSHGTIDAVEGLAIKCEEDDKLIALTLECGRVYLGLLDEFRGPRIDKDWVGITPLATGYRTASGNLRLTTFYDMGRFQDVAMQASKIVVSMKQIVAAQAFDLALYRPAERSESVDPGAMDAQETAVYQASPAVKTARHCLYLGLPILLLFSPYVALTSFTGGLALVVMAGLSCIAAERLRYGMATGMIENNSSHP